MNNKVYRYGAREPDMNLARVHEQLRRANDYRNDLVQIERGRREAAREILSRHGNVAEEEETCRRAIEEVRAASQAAKAERIKTESRINSEPVKKKLAEAKHALKLARAKMTASRRAGQRDLDDVNEKAADLRRAARALVSASGLYWGTYQLVEEAMQQSAKAPLYAGLDKKDPRFKRFEGVGQVSAQLQGGLTLDELGSCADTQARLENVVDRSGRDRYRRVWLRIGSDGRKPIWTVVPIFFHRPLPPGSKIKRVTLDLKRMGPKKEWAVLFVLDLPDATSPCGNQARPEACGHGAVAVNVGWRSTGDGELRVATTFDGVESSELRLDARTVQGFVKVEGLKAVRDKLLLEAIEKVKAVRDKSGSPDWFRERTSHVHQWRSEARMSSLVRRWSENRFAGDDDAFTSLLEWRKTDVHLWHYESGAAINVHRRRREAYAIWSAEMARRYDTLVIDKFDLRDVTRRPAVGADSHQGELARYQRRVAAVSQLRACLVNAFHSRGGKVVVTDPAEITMTCNDCGIVEVFDAAAKIRHTCANGHEWDQDINAAKNTFERRSGGGGGGIARDEIKPKGDGPLKEGRWDRVKRMAAEKKDRKEGARGTVAEAAE